ncbi:hypothetical protein niasHT_031612 [Heterodera trifolii]|uniref:Uncharacterized protein n=1 Tax=Heterodera trifolii TaxID=157864 RepID=A0ABD2IXS7_9BILA
MSTIVRRHSKMPIPLLLLIIVVQLFQTVHAQPARLRVPSADFSGGIVHRLSGDENVAMVFMLLMITILATNTAILIMQIVMFWTVISRPRAAAGEQQTEKKKTDKNKIMMSNTNGKVHLVSSPRNSTELLLFDRKGNAVV